MCHYIYYIWSLIIYVILSILIPDAYTQPDLCRNPKIDSIEWIESQRQYFFTSGGYWWLIKESEMPPPSSKAKKLLYGFTKGESAVLKDTMRGCGKSRYRQIAEHEIILSELMPDGRHMLMVYDLRDQEWKTPIQYNQDKAFSAMKLDWSKSLDAMFNYKLLEIYVVQSTRYTGANFSKLCQNTNAFADAFTGSGNITDFNTLNKIDAMFTKSAPQGNQDLYMFAGDDYYVFNIDSKSGNGKFFGQKQQVKSIAKDFFRYTNECGAAGTPPKPQPTDAPLPRPVSEPYSPPNPEPEQNTTTDESKKGGMLWIIIGVVLLIIVIAVIVILIFIMMRRKKHGETNYISSGSGSRTSLKSGGSKASLKSGVSKTSLRSVSKHGSSAGSKASASPSALGTSPSKVSQRSLMSATSKVQ